MKGVPSTGLPLAAATFPAMDSRNCPIVIRDGIAWGLTMMSGTTPSGVKGISSCGTIIPMTPFCPWREANLSPSSGMRWSRTLTFTSLLPSPVSVIKMSSTTPVSAGLTSIDVSLMVGPLTSNSLYSSRNLGGLVLPMRTSPPVTSDSRLTMPSGSRRR